jgi:hypothetical protein
MREMLAEDIGIRPWQQLAVAMRPFFAERRNIDAEGYDKARAAVAAAGITIHAEGGNCPVQIEGTFDGFAFYFRARGSHWEFHVFPAGGKMFDDDVWEHDQEYGKWPAAGWMPLPEALGFVVDAVNLFRGTQS